MKKLLFSLVAAAVCMLSAHSAFAQDIIFTKASEVIEAVVVEVNDDDIVYKSYDNPEGPVYRMSVDRIAKIRYMNGKEDVFGNVPEQPVAGGQVFLGEPVPYGNMRYDSGAMYLDGNMLTYADMQACMPLDLYNQARGGLKMRNSGKKLMIAGGVITGVSVILIVAGAASLASQAYYNEGVYYDMALGQAFAITTGCVCIFPGVACLSAGIPLYCVGQSRAKRAAATYNSRGQANQLTLNIGAARSGFGLYLNF